MLSHIMRSSTFRNGKKENGDKRVEPIRRPPPIHPHFAPLRVPIGRFPLILFNMKKC